MNRYSMPLTILNVLENLTVQSVQHTFSNAFDDETNPPLHKIRASTSRLVVLTPLKLAHGENLWVSVESILWAFSDSKNY